MTGKRYYLTTLAAWQRHLHRFATSHFLILTGAPTAAGPPENSASGDGEGNCAASASSAGATRILVLVEGDEGAHLALDDDPAFEALPHPLAQKPISTTAQAALAPHGVAPGATTFDAAEALARIHPLLRHRVF